MRLRLASAGMRGVVVWRGLREGACSVVEVAG